MGRKEFGIDLQTISSITKQIADVHQSGIRLSIVVGGGNIFRGISASSSGMDRSSADYTGMMATVINSLILQQRLTIVIVNVKNTYQMENFQER